MSWDYEDFKDELKRIGFDVRRLEKEAKKWRAPLHHGGLIMVGQRPALVNSWVTGGTRGAGYWGQEGKHSFDGDPEPEWADLLKVLDRFSPNISYLKFRRLMASAIGTETDQRSDYYGNETNYQCKFTFVEDLFNFLRNEDLFEIQPVDDSE
jgi:hypothetical protein